MSTNPWRGWWNQCFRGWLLGPFQLRGTGRGGSIPRHLLAAPTIRGSDIPMAAMLFNYYISFEHLME